MPQPGGDGGIGFGLELRIFQPALQIGPALLDQGVQAAELIEGLAVDAFALGGGLLGEFAVVAGEERGVVVQGGLGAGEVGVAELLGLLLHFVGQLGVHVADAEADEIVASAVRGCRCRRAGP